jgi:U32 family peptidase
LSELLAPAGSFESLQSAINAGCDSVYFGVEQLNMRQSANFGLKDLPEIVKRCREAKIRCYLTLNTLLYDHDMNIMKEIVDAAKKHGVDACIVSDMAAIQYCREVGMEVHISTQLSVSNIETAKFYSQFADRVVLARELSLPLVKKICDEIKKEDLRGPNGRPLEIEAFIHGAMCVAVSGRCGMSLFTNNSSANRGACVQNCRKSYKVVDEETGQELKIDNNFVMSPEDLCTINFFDKIMESGIHTFKVEGRGRSPDYVHNVISSYREAIESITNGSYNEEKIKDWMESMGEVYNRGLSSGYYLGKHMDSWSKTHGSKATKEKIKIGKIRNYYKEPKVAWATLEGGEISVGDEFLITGPTTGVVRGIVESLMKDDAPTQKAGKGAEITFNVESMVRPSDTLFRVAVRDGN